MGLVTLLDLSLGDARERERGREREALLTIKKCVEKLLETRF
jgi:hypothetical protein